MPQVSRRCRGAATASALLGTLLALAALLLCTDPRGGAPAATAAVTAPGGVPASASALAPASGPASATAPGSADEREPGCRGRHRDGVGSAPVTPPRKGAAYELLPALYDAGDGAGSWGAGGPARRPAPGHRPPPLDPPSPIGLSILRV
ncbi:hypothetical protein [Streptomyces sp. Wb2n-11]|uniref:hypothetical protein n=1 Tax=Streptomyces sp. Wb2n-11 TaxID=1030533 RepID=UPI000A81A0F7|nr:hypothetical protein [Streptomyces sp. Wb2n-11]